MSFLRIDCLSSPNGMTTRLMALAIQARSSRFAAAGVKRDQWVQPGQCTKVIVERELQTASVVGLFAHGQIDSVIGEKARAMLSLSTPPPLVARRIFCLTACSAGATLGPWLMRNGARAVFAYRSDLPFDAASIVPLAEATCEADIAAAQGDSPPQIEQRLRAAFGSAIAAAGQSPNVSTAAHLTIALRSLYSQWR